MTKKPKLFSLDVSIQNTAVGYFHDIDVVTKSFKTSSCKDVPHRIVDIVDGVYDFVFSGDASKFGRETILVFIEDFAYSSNNAIHAAQVTGALKYLLCKRFGERIKFVYVSPPTLKKFISNDGKSDKIAMAVHTYERWGKKFPNSDECDAYCLARFGYAYCNKTTLLKRELECIKTVYKSTLNGEVKEFCSYKDDF